MIWPMKFRAFAALLAAGMALSACALSSAWAQPTVVSGRVFVGSQNGTVYALSATTGCTWWTFSAGGRDPGPNGWRHRARAWFSV